MREAARVSREFPHAESWVYLFPAPLYPHEERLPEVLTYLLSKMSSVLSDKQRTALCTCVPHRLSSIPRASTYSLNCSGSYWSRMERHPQSNRRRLMKTPRESGQKIIAISIEVCYHMGEENKSQ